MWRRRETEICGFPESGSLCQVREEVNEKDTVWNHQHILGFEDPIQSLLSLRLWLTRAVSNTWHSQTLLRLRVLFFFTRISFIRVSQVEINVL